MSALKGKSLTALRGIAQSYSIPDIFQKDELQLRQAIELKQQDMTPQPKIEIPKPEYDARLMNRPPAKRSDEKVAMDLLQPYIARGLHVRFDEECWYMSLGKKNDSGTIRMPLRVLLDRADRMMANG